MMWGIGYGGWGNGLWSLGPFIMLIFWGLVVTGVVLLIRYLSRQDKDRVHG